MKVSELINKLAQLDQNLEVYCFDEGRVPIPTSFEGPFEIISVSTKGVVPIRNQDGKPLMKFNDAENSKKIVIIGMTSDF
jgi:hypothetical protein